jgi:hypothetical protein
MLLPNGTWIDLYGGNKDDQILTTTHLVSAPMVQKGENYSFRYRSRNVYYWSEWSPTLTVLAANVPSPPPRPEFISATNNAITIQLFESEDIGGSVVTNYELWMDQGQAESAFTIVSTYDTTGFLFTHTVTFALDGVTTGLIYSFQFRSMNSKGYSDFSERISIACSSPPPQPSPPNVNYKLSSKDQLFITWTLLPDAIGPGGLIIGYKLYADDGSGGSFRLI